MVFLNIVGCSKLLFKVSSYKMGVSMRLHKLQALCLFKPPFSISGENRSLSEHVRAKFGLNEQLSSQNQKPELNLSKSELNSIECKH